MSSSTEWTTQSIQTIIDALKHKPGAMLPILHAIQDEIGYIPDKAISLIADSLLQTRAEVHGVISFYHHFRTTPPGRHTIEICRAEACQAMGCRSLEQHAKTTLGIDYHQTTADRRFSLEAVYCLGNCATAPSIRIDNDIHGRVSLDKFDALIREHQNDMKEAG